MRFAEVNVLPPGLFLSSSSAVHSEDTEVDLQRCLNRLARATDDVDVRTVVREALSVSAGRILLLCGSTLSRHYPRLTRGPLNLQAEELLSAVVERLIKAMRHVRPRQVREFFALVMRHLRWELNELARDVDADKHERLAHDAIAQEPEEICEEDFSPRTRRILAAINNLPQPDREIFNLVRLQGTTHADAADVLGISVKTVQRRLNRFLPHLWAQLGELQPSNTAPSQRDKTLRPRFAAAKETVGQQSPKQVA
jgi:RNA polymerase sigma factor (sigma-70 family)